MILIATHIEAFLQDYLPKQRRCSSHTSEAYAYSFQLLFTFVATHLKITPCEISLQQLDAKMITDFLEDLEVNRDCAVSTRNARLAAIKSFYRFLEYRVPASLEQIRQVLAIPFKKTDSKVVPYLNEEETKAILKLPNLEKRMGIRDYAMIQLAVAAGVRVAELVGLQVLDLDLKGEPSILIHGKGRRERVLPLWKETARSLRKWLAVRGDLDASDLFVNAQDEPMSRWGFAYILKKYVKQASDSCPSLKEKKTSPHVLRHTCAMVILKATHDIRKVALWLGHSSTQTTEVYVRADPTDKLEAIEAITLPKLRKGRYQAPDKLMKYLKSQTLCGVNSSKKEGSKPVQRNHSP